jgi:release factor glutamine methyltransferase
MKLGEALPRAAARLDAAGLDDARREARLLAAHVLGLAPGQFLDPAREIDMAAFEAAVARRAERREPLAFITGRQGFWTLDLEVSPSTLIPRADSETLIEAALKMFPERGRVRTILDLGTGTGALLLAALSAFPAAFGVGVDLSPDAALLAARNAGANGLGGRAAFLAGSWAESLKGTFDLVLANPPYIETAAIGGLMPEVGLHEPRRALDGGADGLDAYRALLGALPVLLAPGGAAILELGEGQARSVCALAEAAGLHHVGVDADLAGIPRAAKLCRAIDAADFEKKPFGSTAVGG